MPHGIGIHITSLDILWYYKGDLTASSVAGIPGKCSPPNRRIASLYRHILSAVERKELSTKYQVTQEATHHGPYVDIPACFVEIGSTEVDWPDPDAGRIWAEVLVNDLGIGSSADTEKIDPNALDMSLSTDRTKDIVDDFDMDDRETSNEDRKELVIISIGGGHYVPRMNDLARLGTIC